MLYSLCIAWSSSLHLVYLYVCMFMQLCMHSLNEFSKHTIELKLPHIQRRDNIEKKTTTNAFHCTSIRLKIKEHPVYCTVAMQWASNFISHFTVTSTFIHDTTHVFSSFPECYVCGELESLVKYQKRAYRWDAAHCTVVHTQPKSISEY